jgi:ligand-binding sensor domain-containing protein/serine phosphatase RsbU (regulator of sigma subunit)
MASIDAGADLFTMAWNADGSLKWTNLVLIEGSMAGGYALDSDCSMLYYAFTAQASLLNSVYFPGGTTIDSGDASDMILAGVNLDDGLESWVKLLSDPGTTNMSYSLAVDQQGTLVLGGTISSLTNWSPFSISNVLSSTQAFAATYGTDGTFVNAIDFGGTAVDQAYDVALTSSSLFVGGLSSQMFDLSLPAVIANNENAFAAKFTKQSATVVSNCLTPVAAGTASASNYAPAISEIVTLDVTGQVGNIQWQKSTDGETWLNINGAVAATYLHTVTEDIYMRTAAWLPSCGYDFSDKLFLDIIDVVLLCPNDVTVDADANCQYVLPDYTAFDLALGNYQDPPAGTLIGLGDTEVKLYSATDVLSCSFVVTVKDTSPPTATCPSNFEESANADCEFIIPDYTGLGTYSDNCGFTVSQNDGLLKIDQNLSVTHYHLGLEDFTFYSLGIEGDLLLIGTDFGLITAKLVDDKPLKFEYVDDIAETKVSSIKPCKKSKWLIGTEDSGAFQLSFQNGSLVITDLQTPGIDLTKLNINHLQCGVNDDLYVSTNLKGLIKLSNRQGNTYTRSVDFNEGGLIGTGSINMSFLDREGNLWMATNGRGLVKLVDDYFTFFTYEDYGEQVNAICHKGDSTLLGTESALIYCDKSPSNLVNSETILNEEGIPCAISAICYDLANNLWVGTKSDGLFQKTSPDQPFKKFALGDDRSSNRINQLMIKGGLLWVGTDFGIYQIKDGEIRSHITMQGGLPHNVVNAMYTDSRNRTWVGTEKRGIVRIDQMITQVDVLSQEEIVAITCFAESADGVIWFGTDGAGVHPITPLDTVVYTKYQGLASDYCYSIACDEKNRLWVGHRGGLSRIDLATHEVKTFDPGNKEQIDFMPNATARSEHGILGFGTNKGYFRYDHEKDVLNTMEPALNMVGINISDSAYAICDKISLPNGRYKIKFDFVGVSFKNSADVHYKYILEGHDLGWSELETENSITYNALGAGSYLFKVTSFNADGYGGEVIKEVRLVVDNPFWAKWWFIVSMSVVLIGAIRFIIIRRERLMKKTQAYLKRELNARTREVVEQKELLEIKNKDITDSIVYAKSIQKAMLPAPDALSHHFPESFVIFKPRDIVSGDFYWVDEFEDKIIVACADCTGHGVPGAFMSLIGSALLKEVARTAEVHSPSIALSYLDSELREMLNREGNKFGVQDGMDISIVEIDKKTLKFRGASAKRPIVIYKNGRLLELKGDRFSIGGDAHGSQTKNYTLHELDLEPGDIVYQFSDGISDQFGGSLGKKLKKTGLLEIIGELAHLNLTEQGRLIRERFKEWQGSLAQVDDVIMLGVKI